jgi:hypothetical protein
MAAQITSHLAFSSITVASNNLHPATSNSPNRFKPSVLAAGPQICLD